MTAAGAHSDHDLVLVVDFGAQYAQLIARRVREARVYSEIVPHTMPVAEMLARNPKAIVLSGGPSLGLRARARPTIDPALFDGRRPGVRHVLRLPADGAGRSAARSRTPAPASTAAPRSPSPAPGTLLAGVPDQHNVWMSHGDSVVAAPEGFTVLASTAGTPVAAFEDRRPAAGRRPVAPGGDAHRARAAGARALPARHRRLPADLDDGQHRRGAGRGDPRPGRRRAGRSAGCPAASTPRSPPRSCSAPSATGSPASTSTTA